ncbi:MAG: 50S ribosomal protein L6 [Proteobacteria bacterium]|nr:50S ribosomal protein L6 [Pseudomonadota bacterium]
MSRFIKNSIAIPDGVEVKMQDGLVSMSGPNGAVSRQLDDKRLQIKKDDNGLTVSVLTQDDDQGMALAGTYWRLLDGMVKGVQVGAEKILELVGVGYRAQMEGNDIVLQLGFSHPVRYTLPTGISANMPSQTEIHIKGADKQLVGQAAAKIRSYRPPEPYKGKGVRYRGERIIMKETKKK